MKKYVVVCLFVLQTTHVSSDPEGIYILIHGTWGTDATWHQPDSEFYTTLKTSAARYNKKIVSFTWKGKFNHKTRAQAAKKLAKLIQSYPHTMNINIISHSHGSNVGNLASQFLSQMQDNKHEIDCFYAFGTPVNTKKYMPNMQVIKRYFNFFSFSDWVQPIFGFFSRMYPSHARIANIRIMINSANPSHRTILSPTVAQWLPDFPDRLRQQKLGNFERFDFMKPSFVHFSGESCPLYQTESRRSQIVKREAYALTLLASKIALEKGNVART